MKSVRLTLCPEEPFNPVFGIFIEGDYIDSAQLVHWNIGNGGLPTFLFYVEGDRAALSVALSQIPKVEEFDITPVSDDHWYLYVRATDNAIERAAYTAFTRDGLILVPPLEYSPAGVSFDIVGRPETLQAALDRLPPSLQYQAEHISEYTNTERTILQDLSPRQREAVRVAVELGYYDAPRRTNIEEIAEHLECAPPTAAEHLRKAESKLVRTIVE